MDYKHIIQITVEAYEQLTFPELTNGDKVNLTEEIIRKYSKPAPGEPVYLMVHNPESEYLGWTFIYKNTKHKKCLNLQRLCQKIRVK